MDLEKTRQCLDFRQNLFSLLRNCSLRQGNGGKASYQVVMRHLRHPVNYPDLIVPSVVGAFILFKPCFGHEVIFLEWLTGGALLAYLVLRLIFSHGKRFKGGKEVKWCRSKRGKEFIERIHTVYPNQETMDIVRTVWRADNHAFGPDATEYESMARIAELEYGGMCAFFGPTGDDRVGNNQEGGLLGFYLYGYLKDLATTRIIDGTYVKVNDVPLELFGHPANGEVSSVYLLDITAVVGGEKRFLSSVVSSVLLTDFIHQVLRLKDKKKLKYLFARPVTDEGRQLAGFVGMVPIDYCGSERDDLPKDPIHKLLLKSTYNEIKTSLAELMDEHFKFA